MDAEMQEDHRELIDADMSVEDGEPAADMEMSLAEMNSVQGSSDLRMDEVSVDAFAAEEMLDDVEIPAQSIDDVSFDMPTEADELVVDSAISEAPSVHPEPTQIVHSADARNGELIEPFHESTTENELLEDGHEPEPVSLEVEEIQPAADFKEVEIVESAEIDQTPAQESRLAVDANDLKASENNANTDADEFNAVDNAEIHNGGNTEEAVFVELVDDLESPAASDDSSEVHPSVHLHCLEHVQMPEQLAHFLAGGDANDQLTDIVRAPPVKLSYNNDDFWLFAENFQDAEQDQPVASTSAIPMSNNSLLFDGNSDQQLYYGPLDQFIEKLHAAFPSFRKTQMEIKLIIDGLSIEIPEDNIYTRDVSLHDLDRIHIGCELSGRLHVTLKEAPRFVYRFNTLAHHVAKFNSEAPEFDDVEETPDLGYEEEERKEQDQSLEEIFEENAEVTNDMGEDVAYADDGTTETLVDDTPQEELDEEAKAEQPFDETHEDEAHNDELSAAEVDPDQTLDQYEDAHEQLDTNGDELQEHGANGDDELDESEVPEDVPDEIKRAASEFTIPRSSSKRSRDELLETNEPSASETFELIPESKKVRAA